MDEGYKVSRLEVVIKPDKEIYLQSDNVDFRVEDRIEYLPTQQNNPIWIRCIIASISFVGNEQGSKGLLISVKLKDGTWKALNRTDKIRHLPDSLEPMRFTVAGRLDNRESFFCHFFAKNKKMALLIVDEIYSDDFYFLFEKHLTPLHGDDSSIKIETTKSFYNKVCDLLEHAKSINSNGFTEEQIVFFTKRVVNLSTYVKWYASTIQSTS